MNNLADLIAQFLPSRRHQLSSGWWNFCCPYCAFNGTTPDKRNRGGFFADGDSVKIKCFNCGFKTMWRTGYNIPRKLVAYLEVLGASSEDISRLYFLALGAEKSQQEEIATVAKALPKDAKPLEDWLDNPSMDFLMTINYLDDRGMNLAWYPFYWAPSMSKRVIIPIYRNNKIFGYSARAWDPKITPKYKAEYCKDFIFNEKILFGDRKIVPVMEGILDAIAIDGVAIMGNEINAQQLALLNAADKDLVIVPDKDEAGIKLVDYAVNNGWAVSFPKWDVKDTAESVQKYGRVLTIQNILAHTVKSELKIKLGQRNYFKEVECKKPIAKRYKTYT